MSFRSIMLACALIAFSSWSALTGQTPAASEERLVLIVPLAEDGSYSLLDFCRASNKVLKTTYPLEQIADRRVTISREEKNLLKLAALAGIETRFERTRLVLRLPNPESDLARREQQRRLEKMLGLPLGAWPSDFGMRLPENLRPEAPTMVFVHGLHATSRIFDGFADEARAYGAQVVTFDYPNTGAVQAAGERCAEELRGLQRRHPRLRLVVVAHSMGGLVTRYALEIADPRLTCVTDVFFLGTPHQGSQVAKFQPVLEFAESALGRQTLTDRASLGEAREDLQPGSAVLRKLADARRPETLKYHTIAGTRGLAAAKDIPELRTLFERYLRRRTVSEEERLRLLTYFDGLDEIVSGKGDGAVALASTRLTDVGSARTFALNHLELVDGDHPEVMRHILKTLRWEKN